MSAPNPASSSPAGTPPAAASPSTTTRRSPDGLGARRPLWRLFLVFLGPMILSNILQSLSGTLNTMFLGQMMGVKALAAVASFFPVMFVFIAFIIGLGAGGSVLIGQAWGAGQIQKVRAIAGTTLLMGLLFGAVVALFGGLFTRPIMQLLGTPADILEQATTYSRIVLLGMPGLFVFLLATSLLRGVGDTLSPMWSLILSTAIGLVSTPALIAGWWGLPQLGVTSAAVSMILGFSVSLLWLGVHLYRQGSVLAPNRALLKALRIDRELLKGVLHVGVPTGVLMIATSLAGLVVMALVNGFGSDATAAFGAVNQINSFAQFPLISVAITSSILAAQSIGADDNARLPAIARTAMLFTVLLGSATALLGSIFARPLLGIFITNAEVLHTALELLYIVLWSGLLFGAFASLSSLMRASGDVVMPTAITIGVLAVLELPLAWLLSQRFGLVGIWLAFPLSYGITLGLQAWYYHAVWKKRPIRKLV